MVPENSSRAVLARQSQARFYKTRQRVSMGLLLFVVIAGLPIVGVPSLRNRLSTRVLALKTAMSGEIKPATLDVGANRQPIPAEYERPAPQLPKFPELPKPPETSMTIRAARPHASARGSSKIEIQSMNVTPNEPVDQAPEATASSSAEPQLKYQKGKAEQDAYDLLLKTNKTVAGMVQGSDPSLKFKSWDAANRGEDVYWVRLKFQSGTNPDEEYIWQVKLQSNEVTPLSHNARTVS